jgi:pseudaminic acid cytidylyltransferase
MRLAIIPARGGSKRIPHKNIAEVGGRPMLSHVLGMAERSGLFDKIHVSTDDPAIAAVAKNCGFPPDFPRDPRLADDHTTLLPVLRWVVERYAERGETFDEICLLMATAVLIEAEDVAGAHRLFAQAKGARPVIAIAEFPCPVEWAFRLNPDNSLQAVQPGMDQLRSQDLPKAYYDSGTFIWYPAAMMAEGSPPPNYLAYPIPRWKAVDIDGPEDLEMAARLFRGGQ